MKLSLITVTFNSATTLEDTLRSVFLQNYSDYEYLIIDGGSTDGTLQLIQQFEPLFGGRLRWISEPDRGIYDAMNKGIRMATGEVIGFLNSDDFLAAPDVAARQMACFTEEVDAVHADVHYVQWDDTARLVRKYASAGFRRWKMRIGLQPAHPTFYCRKAVYERYGCFDLQYKIAADFECMFRFIYMHRIRIVYNPILVVKMRTGGASSSGLASHRQIMKDHLRAFHSHGVYANAFMLSLRYWGKVWDLVEGRFKKVQ